MLKVLRLLFCLSVLLAACAAPSPVPAPSAVPSPVPTLTALSGPGVTVAPTAAPPTHSPVPPTAPPALTLRPQTESPTATPLPTTQAGAIEPANAARVQQLGELRKSFVISETLASAAYRGGPLTGLTATSLSPDGKQLAVATVPGIFLYDLATFKQIGFFNTGSGVVDQVFFLSDGHTLAAFSPHAEDENANQGVSLWDIDSGQLLRTMSLTPNVTRLGKLPLNMSLSPDGRTLAVGFVEGDITLVDVMTGQELPAWKGVDVRAASFVFSPDGRRLATMYGNTTIWDVATRRALLVPVKYGTAVGLYVHAAFSPDGRLVATDGDGDGVKVWDIDTGQMLRTLPGTISPNDNTASGPAFSPDGQPPRGADGPRKPFSSST